MESGYYEIYIKNYNKTLIFCKKEDYKGYTDFDTKTTFSKNALSLSFINLFYRISFFINVVCLYMPI